MLVEEGKVPDQLFVKWDEDEVRSGRDDDDVNENENACAIYKSAISPLLSYGRVDSLRTLVEDHVLPSSLSLSLY